MEKSNDIEGFVLASDILADIKDRDLMPITHKSKHFDGVVGSIAKINCNS